MRHVAANTVHLRLACVQRAGDHQWTQNIHGTVHKWKEDLVVRELALERPPEGTTTVDVGCDSCGGSVTFLLTSRRKVRRERLRHFAIGLPLVAIGAAGSFAVTRLGWLEIVAMVFAVIAIVGVYRLWKLISRSEYSLAVEIVAQKYLGTGQGHRLLKPTGAIRG